MTFEISAVDEEGKTVLGRFSNDSLRFRICYSQSSIYCEEENRHFQAPLFLPSHLPSSGSPEHWQTFLDCCFGQFVERKGLQVFPRLSGGGGGCCGRTRVTDPVIIRVPVQTDPHPELINLRTEVDRLKRDLKSANDKELQKANEETAKSPRSLEEITRLTASLTEKTADLETAKRKLLEMHRMAEKQESSLQDELQNAIDRYKTLENSLNEANETNQRLHTFKAKTKEKEVQVSSPRPRSRETIVVAVDEHTGMDFDALQINSSDLQSRLICAWGMFMEAEKTGLQSYAEKILAWIRANGDGGLADILGQTHLTIVHLSMQVTVMRPLASALQQMQHIRHVILQHANIEAEATRILCEGLQNVTGLLTLDLQYNSIGTVGAIEIGRRKKNWKNLTTLYLNDPTSDPIGPKGAEALFGISAEDKAVWEKYAEKTYLNSLERVCLGGHQIKDEGVQHLVKAFLYMEQVTTLFLYENGITNQGADLLIENIQFAVNLTYIYTGGNSVSSDRELRLQQALSSRQVKPPNPRPQEYEPVVLRTKAEQPPGVKRIIIDLPSEQAVTDFEALQNNSSDLQSRLICAWGMFMEAENTRESYAQKIMAWIRTNGDPAKILEQTRLMIVHLSMQVTVMRPLASALQQMQHIRHVILQHANIEAEATRVLCEGLQHATSLLTLDLQYNSIGTAGAIEIGKRKKDWKNLTTLYLNDPQSSPIGPKGVEALFDISAEDRAVWEEYAEKTYLNSLERVCLGGHQIRDEGVEHLVKAFTYMEQIQTLYLYENGITGQGADLLIANIHVAVNLTYISTRGNSMSSDQESRLQQVLSSRQVKPANPRPQEYEPVVLRTLPNQPPGVERIFIQQDLPSEQAVMDFEAVQNNSSDLQSRLICAWGMFMEAENTRESYVQKIMAWIRTNGDPAKIFEQTRLMIVHLSIQVTVMRPLASALQQMQHIRHVILQHANIEAEATRVLCEGLQHATSLLTLDLQYNSIGTAGAIEIGKRKKDWKNLTTLYLNDPQSSPIGPKGVEALFDISAEDRAVWEEYAGKTYLNSLERVCLGGHQIRDEGVEHLVKAFTYMEQIQTLYLYENGITGQGADLLIANIHVAVNLTYISTRGNSMSSDQESRLQQVLSSRQVKPANPRPQEYEPVVLRTLPDQPPGVERIFIQQDLPSEQALTDFEAVQNNSSDLQSRLICAWGMFMEAENTRESYAQKIMAWIRTNGDPAKILEQTRLMIVHLSMQVTVMRPLASALQQMQHIRHVILQHANIEAEATRVLCEGLQHATSLLTLDLQYNSIGTAGAIEIGKRKKDWKNLTTLYLNDPQSSPIGPKGVEALFDISAEDRAVWEEYAEKTYLNSLERVCLGGHQIRDEGVEHLVKAFTYMEQIQTLYLYENGITGQGADLLIANIHVAVNLTYISTRGNSMSSDQESRLQQVLSSRQVKPANPRPQEYEPVVLRTLPDQPPGIERIFIQGDVQKLIAVLRNKVQCFDVATSQWQQFVALRKNIQVNHTTSSTFIPPNRILVCGGGDTVDSACTRHVDNSAYMLEGDGSVQKLPHMSTGRIAPGLAWDSVRQALYVFGGGTCYTALLRTSEMFLSKWSPLPDMHQVRNGFNPCWHSAIVYLCGGFTNSVETYDPRSNTFALQDFILPESEDSIAVVESGTITVISCNYISKLQQGRLTSKKHEHYWPWSNCTPLLSGGVGYVVRLSENCCRCIDLTTGAVRKLS